jgi:hypothetical protein
MKHLKLDHDAVNTCVKDSFSNSKWSSPTTTNEMIDSEIAYWKEYGTNIYPSIVINKKTFRGQIEPLAVFNAICASFHDPPKQCLKTLHKEPITSLTQVRADIEAAFKGQGETVSVSTIITIVTVLILANVVVVYCCRRKARRDMNREMNV